MTPVLQPFTRHADVVGGAFTFRFDQEFQSLSDRFLPRSEGLEQLQTIAGGRNLYLHAAAVFGGAPGNRRLPQQNRSAVIRSQLVDPVSPVRPFHW